MRAARSTDWKNLPLPPRRITIPLDQTYTGEEVKSIKKGLIPSQMEDKWFIYWENGTLFLHRSWTGFCIYAVHFVPEGKGFRAISADVNRDPDQYMETDDRKDAGMILYLIDLLLLEKESMCPDNGSSPLKLWSWVGRAMFGQHPGDE